jgi:hypothetical protein
VPKFRQVAPEARSRLVSGAGQSKGYQERAPYREAVASLTNGQLIEIEPEESENLRQVKVRLRRAAKEVGRDVQYGETREGTLLIWLAEVPRQRRRRRTGDQDGELPAPQEEMTP